MIELNAFLGYMSGKPGVKAIMVCYQMCWATVNIKYELYCNKGSYDYIYIKI